MYSLSIILMSATLYVCSARNAMGRFWYSTNTDEAIAKADAIRQCQAHSLFGCYSTGCTSSSQSNNQSQR